MTPEQQLIERGMQDALDCREKYDIKPYGLDRSVVELVSGKAQFIGSRIECQRWITEQCLRTFLRVIMENPTQKMVYALGNQILSDFTTLDSIELTPQAIKNIGDAQMRALLGDE